MKRDEMGETEDEMSMEQRSKMRLEFMPLVSTASKGLPMRNVEQIIKDLEEET